MPKVKGLQPEPLFKYSDRRRYGMKPYMGEKDKINRKLADSLLNQPTREQALYYPSHFEYSSTPFYRTETYRNGKILKEDHAISATGGIFNLEFSPDGRILSAACERKNIMIFDPLTRTITKNIENAHQDCVNCVRFLDTRTFASCSDDTTVALWDVRNLKSRVRTLRGHSNWVKNIEYSHHDNVLVTSGFDGAIYTWDFNKNSENGPEFKKVFYTNGLMRMRLTPDAQKMVISTMNGYLVVIHDLNLSTMGKDLAGFKPNMYRLMQMSGKPLELAINFTRLFHAKRNRVELISDFPASNDAEIISSLRLHPQGWVAVSRNTSGDENSEWCCVHDIQSVQTKEEDDEPIKDKRVLSWGRSPSIIIASSANQQQNRNEGEMVQPPQRYRSGRLEIISTGARYSQQREGGNSVVHIDLTVRGRNRDDQGEEDGGEEGGGGEGPATERAEEVDVDGTNFLAAESVAALDLLGELSRELAEQRQHIATLTNQNQDSRAPARQNEPTTNAPQPSAAGANAADNAGNLVNVVGVGPEVSAENNDNRPVRNERAGHLIIGGTGSRRVVYFGSPAARRAQQERIPEDAKIHKNISRLTHYIEESNSGRGFIKEQCFSPCGRFIASPFGYGVRLLGWNAACSDLSDCVPKTPTVLHEIGLKSSHQEAVLSSAFSPTHWLLVTGCLAGRISWNQPTF